MNLPKEFEAALRRGFSYNPHVIDEIIDEGFDAVGDYLKANQTSTVGFDFLCEVLASNKDSEARQMVTKMKNFNDMYILWLKYSRDQAANCGL